MYITEYECFLFDWWTPPLQFRILLTLCHCQTSKIPDAKLSISYRIVSVCTMLPVGLRMVLNTNYPMCLYFLSNQALCIEEPHSSYLNNSADLHMLLCCLEYDVSGVMTSYAKRRHCSLLPILSHFLKRIHLRIYYHWHGFPTSKALSMRAAMKIAVFSKQTSSHCRHYVDNLFDDQATTCF